MLHWFKEMVLKPHPRVEIESEVFFIGLEGVSTVERQASRVLGPMGAQSSDSRCVGAVVMPRMNYSRSCFM